MSNFSILQSTSFCNRYGQKQTINLTHVIAFFPQLTRIYIISLTYNWLHAQLNSDQLQKIRTLKTVIWDDKPDRKKNVFCVDTVFWSGMDNAFIFLWCCLNLHSGRTVSIMKPKQNPKRLLPVTWWFLPFWLLNIKYIKFPCGSDTWRRKEKGEQEMEIFVIFLCSLVRHAY